MKYAVQTSNPQPTPGECEVIDLGAGQTVVIENNGNDRLLHIEAQHKRLLSIRLYADHAELQLTQDCTVRTRGNMAFEGTVLSFRASEELHFESGGNATFSITGDLVSSASAQTIRATLGNVNLRANDDVKLQAERILLNT
jgi:hypothetical protein